MRSNLEQLPVGGLQLREALKDVAVAKPQAANAAAPAAAPAPRPAQQRAVAAEAPPAAAPKSDDKW
ncbi:hypothetical protein D3C81_2022820 [compost metagenome]